MTKYEIEFYQKCVEELKQIRAELQNLNTILLVKGGEDNGK